MAGRGRSNPTDRVELVRLIKDECLSKSRAASRLGYSPEWARKWWRRYRRGGEAGLMVAAAPPPGPLARFNPEVAAAVTAQRQTHPLVGARRAQLDLGKQPSLQGQRLPSPSTIHRAWRQAGLVRRRLPRDTAPTPASTALGEPHAVWEIDHQDHIELPGFDTRLVLQGIRAPLAGLHIGADLFLGPRGASAVPEDDLFDALRRRWIQWGRPRTLSVDAGVRFLGQPQRRFPSRLELLCAGLDIVVAPIRPGRPTDHAAIERQHWTLDGYLIGPDYAGDLARCQAALNEHLLDLNERFPSRAKTCGGRPPLVAHPQARHSGRAYDPAREWDEFDLGAVDRLLAGWQWRRLVTPRSGQISFADRNVGVGKAWIGKVVDLRFDPASRQIVVHEPGRAPDRPGAPIKSFHCPAFDKEMILGQSKVAYRPTAC